MKKSRVLIVDDQPGASAWYERELKPLRDSEGVISKSVPGLELSFESNLSAVAGRLAAGTFDLLIIGVHPPNEADALKLLESSQAGDPRLPVVMVATSPTVETATASLRLGARDYLTAPLEGPVLPATIERLLQGRRLDDEHELLLRQVERPYSFDDIIGTCPPMRKVFDTIAQVADSGIDVLVIGETGTGKELVARSIHRRSRRADRPFVPVDCGAIPENLLESEFFGHERGAFTGADARRIGLLEFADGGTFFLDELGELPLLLQAKLLRTLQERKIRRVGGREETDIDVRIVAATSRDLDALIQGGQFREDLYYRINVVRIELPPLRDRGDDLGLLAEYMATRYGREMGGRVMGITPEAFQVLSQYRWPGNVRELQNVVRRAIALSRGTMIGLEDLPDNVIAKAGQAAGSGGRGGYFELRDQHVAEFERQYLVELLQRHQGEVKTAAQEAKVPRGTLYRLMKNHGLDPIEFRRP